MNVIPTCTTRLWLKEAYDGLPENVIRRCFVKANCYLTTNVEVTSEFLRLSSIVSDHDEAVHDLWAMLSQVRYHDDFSQSLGLDDPLRV